MPFLMIRDDIVNVKTDAIVNPANENLQEGSGTSRAIYLAAGEEKLKKACRQIGHCDSGRAVITKGFGLSAKYVIHAVGPLWMGGDKGEEQLLYSAYRESLMLARRYHLESIAFPLLSAGNYHYPKEQAMRVAVRVIGDFLMEHEMLVYLVLYDRSAVSISKTLSDSIDEYIDDHYVETKDEHLEGDRGYPVFREGYSLYQDDEYWKRLRTESREKPPSPPERFLRESVSGQAGAGGSSPENVDMDGAADGEAGSPACPEISDAFPEPEQSASSDAFPEPKQSASSGAFPKSEPSAPSGAFPRPVMSVSPGPPRKRELSALPAGFPKRRLEQILSHMDETFSQMLLRLIDERGLKDSSVYRKANVDRRHFSKIRNDVNYAPNKKTVLAFAIALELSLDETKDLLMRAGFAFSSSSRFDVIVCFFIENRQYDIFEINEALFAYGQPLLGAGAES